MSDFHEPFKGDALQDLVDTLVDVNKGYAEMMERADDPVIAHVQPLAKRHAHDIECLLNEARSTTNAPDTTGSIMGQVHKLVVAARDATTGLDKDVLDAVKRGEDRVLDAYDTAIKVADYDSGLRQLLTEQRAALSKDVQALSAAA